MIMYIENLIEKIRFSKISETGSSAGPSTTFQKVSDAGELDDKKSEKKIQCMNLSIMPNPEIQAIKAELIWAMSNIVDSTSASTNDNKAAIFQAMFPGEISMHYSMGRTKVAYIITEALGPFFRDNILKDIGKHSYYSILFDETLNSKKKKEMQILLRYFSDSNNKVITTHLETVFLENATAEDLKAALEMVINNAELPLNNLVMIGSDGPNVNKKLFRIFSEQLKTERPRGGLLDIGTCPLHVVHNTFLKGLTEFGEEISDLIILLYYFFDDFPSRFKDFEEICQNKNIKTATISKHISTRWLSLLPCAEKLVLQLPALVTYFNVFIPNKAKKLMQTNKYKNIIKILTKKNIEAEIHFVIWSARMFNMFLINFQKDEPMIHKLHTELTSLLLLIAAKVCKNPKKIVEHLFEKDNIKNSNEIEIDNTINIKGTERDVLLFKDNVKNHFLNCGLYLQKQPCLNKILKYFSFIDPKNIFKKDAAYYVKKSAESLKTSESSSTSEDQFRLLQLDLNARESDILQNCNERVDTFWGNIFLEFNKYNDLQKLVKAILALSHGNSSVERSFSKTKLLLGENQTNMTCRTLNAKLNIYYGLQLFNYRPDHVPITDKLISMARNAHRAYKDFLDLEKKQKQELEKRALQDEKTRKEKEAQILESKVSKRKLEELQDDYNSIKRIKDSKSESADKLLLEGNKRLKLAVENLDMVEIQMAQGLIDGAMSLRVQEREMEKTVTNIEKKKNNIITKYFINTTNKTK